VLACKGPYHYEARPFRKDGSVIDISVSAFSVYDGTGKLVGASSIHRDITALKRTEAALLETQAQLRSRLEQQRAVAEFGQQAVRVSELAALLDEAVDLVAKTLDVEYSHVLESAPDGKTLAPRSVLGWNYANFGTETTDAGSNSQARYSLLSNAPVIVDDYKTETRFKVLPGVLERGVQSGLTTMIGGRNRPYGVLGAHTTKLRKFTEDDANFMQAIANILGQAVERIAGDQALRRSEDYFRSAIQASSDAILVLRPDGTITFSSDAARQFGRAQVDYIGTTGLEFVHPDDHEAVRRGWVETLEKGAAQYKLRIRDKDGQWRSCEARDTLAYDPEDAPVIVVSNRDITERKRLEQDLREARDAALTAARLKSEFIANITHEIRTPINAIVGFSGLLADIALNDDQRDMLQNVRTSSDALLSLVNNILDFSKLSAGKLKLENIDFNPREMLEAAVDMFRGAARLEGIGLSLLIDPEVPAALTGDPGRLRQVICNLVGNALKFTERGQVSVNLRVERQQESAVTLRF